ncbi:hypothetical protein CDD83_4375 [Cordyceps sp. RAO-2017]|nr:hypothetical protein CDD83_4375 [Cordyceps sp. RAO-2017]
MSVTSSQYSKRYIGFIDEDDDENDNVGPSPAPIRHRKSSTTKPQNTIKVNGAVIKPTPSLEKMFASVSMNNDNSNDDDDEYDIAPRPVSNRHNGRAQTSCVPEPINVNKIHRKRAAVSNVGFDD